MKITELEELSFLKMVDLISNSMHVNAVIDVLTIKLNAMRKFSFLAIAIFAILSSYGQNTLEVTDSINILAKDGVTVCFEWIRARYRQASYLNIPCLVLIAINMMV